MPKNIDSLNYIIQLANSKQLSELTKKVETLTPPDWHKFLIPGVSFLTAIVGGLFSYWIATALFKRNKELEIKKLEISDNNQKKIREENDKKAIDERIGKLYGEAFGLNSLFLNTVAQINFHLLNLRYFNILYDLTDNENVKAEIREGLEDSEIKKHNSLDKIAEILNRFPAIVGEYHSISQKTEILRLYSQFASINIYYNPIDNFKDEMTITQLEEMKRKLLIGCKNYAQGLIGLSTYLIINTILTGETEQVIQEGLTKRIKEYEPLLIKDFGPM